MMRDVGQKERLGVVHRLERWTSGLIVLARTPSAFESIRLQFIEKTVKREYMVIVCGIPKLEEATLVDQMGVHPTQKRRMAVLEKGKKAQLHYRIVSTSAKEFPVSLLRCRLETGLLHQLRVQLAHAGHPVFGDLSYGRTHAERFQELGVKHPLLHAQTLGFKHPSRGYLHFTSSPHPSFQSLQEHFLLIDAG